jgi:hypothetical protein
MIFFLNSEDLKLIQSQGELIPREQAVFPISEMFYCERYLLYCKQSLMFYCVCTFQDNNIDKIYLSNGVKSYSLNDVIAVYDAVKLLAD